MPRGVRIPVRERILMYKYSVEQAMTPERIWELLFSSREEVVSLEYIRRQCALFDSDNAVLISDYLAARLCWMMQIAKRSNKTRTRVLRDIVIKLRAELFAMPREHIAGLCGVSRTSADPNASHSGDGGEWGGAWSDGGGHSGCYGCGGGQCFNSQRAVYARAAGGSHARPLRIRLSIQ